MLQTNHDLPDGTIKSAKRNESNIEKTKTFAPSIAELKLTDFRSHAKAHIVMSKGIVVLSGDNGVGKTNILEAISMLGPGRGLRTAKLSELARRDGANAWSVSALVRTQEEDIQIGVGIDPGADTRRLRIDGQNVKGFDRLTVMLPQLWLTPAMDRLFVDGASGRRKFLDRYALGLSPQHAKMSQDYERAMRERNRLLQEDPSADSWLDSLESNMAVSGVAIADARLTALDALAAGLQHSHDAFPEAEIALEGWIEAALRQDSALDVEDAFRLHLKNSRGLDASVGRTLEGPHRSDLVVRHKGKDMPASDCSTGEQKALLVGLVLAQARVMSGETGRVPLLLLDEVAAHLDGTRRAALIEVIENLGAQAWITGTDPAVFQQIAFTGTHLTFDGQLIKNA